MDFSSDNITGASAQILQAIVAANSGPAPAYGNDVFTREAEQRLCELFEREVSAFLVATGTGANALALAAVAPPGTAVFCHDEAHVIEDECGAPEFFAGGAKLVGIKGEAGKIPPDALSAMLARFPRGVVRQVQPAALSLSQATEAGTVYACGELAALAEIAHAAGLAVHMDGARFANALVASGVSPAEMTWKAGIDVLSFGATKNGALACEAVIFFDKARAEDFLFRRKRGGHTVSKGRLLGAQMNGYLAEGHWLDLARRANSSARHLAEGLAAIPGLRCPWPTQVNEVFVVLPERVDAALRGAGARYHAWQTRSLAISEELHAGEVLARLLCSFETTDHAIRRFIEVAAAV